MLVVGIWTFRLQETGDCGSNWYAGSWYLDLIFRKLVLMVTCVLVVGIWTFCTGAVGYWTTSLPLAMIFLS